MKNNIFIIKKNSHLSFFLEKEKQTKMSSQNTNKKEQKKKKKIVRPVHLFCSRPGCGHFLPNVNSSNFEARLFTFVVNTTGSSKDAFYCYFCPTSDEIDERALSIRAELHNAIQKTKDLVKKARYVKRLERFEDLVQNIQANDCRRAHLDSVDRIVYEIHRLKSLKNGEDLDETDEEHRELSSNEASLMTVIREKNIKNISLFLLTGRT
jgi:hypothetical protein